MLGNVLQSDQTGSVYQWVQKVPLAMFAYRTTVSRVTGVTPFKGVFGVDSQVPLDIIFPPPPVATKQWPEYVPDQQQQLQSIYQEMRATGHREGHCIPDGQSHQSKQGRSGRRGLLLLATSHQRCQATD